MNAIVGHLVQLPCISLKSGGGVFAEGRSATMGLPLAIDAERTPVIFLDARLLACAGAKTSEWRRSEQCALVLRAFTVV